MNGNEFEKVNDPEQTTIQVPKFMRLPPTGKRDPVCGFSRSFLNELVLPMECNDFQPPVKSYVFRRKGAKTGVRLVDVESLLEYVTSHPQEAGEPIGRNQEKEVK